MDPARIVLLVIYSVGVLNSLFLGGALLVQPGRKLWNRLLSLLLLTFTLRLAKAILVFFRPDLHALYHVVWFGVLAFTGTLFFVYAWTLRPAARQDRLPLLHLVLPTAFVAALVLHPPLIQHAQVYMATLVFYLAYLVLACLGIGLTLRRGGLREITRRWLTGVVVVFVAEGLLYGGYFVRSYNLPAVEAIFFSFTLYILVFAELRWKVVQRVHARPFLETEPDADLLARTEHLMVEEQVFLQPDLTLAELARRVGVTRQVLSRTLNEHFGRNFNDYVNAFCIDEARRRLRDPAARQRTIASIARDCGFHSLSVFNPAFKKATGRTPSQYQKEGQDG